MARRDSALAAIVGLRLGLGNSAAGWHLEQPLHLGVADHRLAWPRGRDQVVGVQPEREDRAGLEDHNGMRGNHGVQPARQRVEIAVRLDVVEEVHAEVVAAEIGDGEALGA